MYVLYTLLYVVGLCLYLPRALRRRVGWSVLRARLGRVPRELYDHPGAVWIHAVSVGEVHAARGLLPHLRKSLPDVPVVLSTTTATGQGLARRTDVETTFYMPLDLPAALKPYFEVLQPRALLLMETEIWPHLLRQCRRRQVPVALVNGRLSERSFRRYRRLFRIWAQPLRSLGLVCARTRQDAERFRRLGHPDERLFMTGNLKADPAALQPPAEVTDELRRELSLDADDPVLVAGCTMPGEEGPVLRAYEALRRDRPELRLLLAPRHPERFEEVDRLVRESGLRCRRRTEEGTGDGAPVLLLDTIGELPAAYGVGTVAFVGGSLVPRGGHNLLEPAVHEIPVLFGPHMDNFASMAESFTRAGGGFRIADADELATKVRELLDDPAERRRAGHRAARAARGDGSPGRRAATVLGDGLGLVP